MHEDGAISLLLWDAEFLANGLVDVSERPVNGTAINLEGIGMIQFPFSRQLEAPRIVVDGHKAIGRIFPKRIDLDLETYRAAVRGFDGFGEREDRSLVRVDAPAWLTFNGKI